MRKTGYQKKMRDRTIEPRSMYHSVSLKHIRHPWVLGFDIASAFRYISLNLQSSTTLQLWRTKLEELYHPESRTSKINVRKRENKEGS